MDAIEQLDWGAYVHFSNEARHHPGILPFMQVGFFYLAGYAGVCTWLLFAVILFLFQERRTSALVALVSFSSAVALIETVRHLVPRRRPEDAANWVGPDHMLGSYPSSSVFLFMLTMILLGFAIWHGARRPWMRGLYILVATLLTVWVCMSNFLLAVHFLTDVLGAIAGATLVGWVACKFLDPPKEAGRKV